VGDFDVGRQALPLHSDCVCPESHLVYVYTVYVYTDLEVPLGEMWAAAGSGQVQRFIAPGVAGPARLVPPPPRWRMTSSAALRCAEPPPGGAWMQWRESAAPWRSTLRAEQAYVAIKGPHREGKR
jgi:hypothetical protein